MPWEEQCKFAESVEKEKNFQEARGYVYKQELLPGRKSAFLHRKLSPPSLVSRKERSIKFSFGFKIHKDKQRIKIG